MAVTLHELCKDLDSLSLQILELVEEQVKCKLMLEQIMKMGFIEIAKSRYIMGNKSVSSLQLPTECSNEFSTNCPVVSEESESGCITFILRQMSLDKNGMQLSCNDCQLKNRKGMKDIQNESTKQVLKNTDDVQDRKFMDPIKWFGVLVPQNLRQAQTSFRNALEVAVKSTNIQSKLLMCVQKHKQLMELKNQNTCETTFSEELHNDV